MTLITGPDGPLGFGFTWPEGICGKETGTFCAYGRQVPLLCTRPDSHDPDEACSTDLAWTE